MSTKSTVAYGPNFHLYREALDDHYIYLELEGAQFEASYNRMMVPIPVHIWEVIRRYAGVDLSFADKTDEEIRAYVEREVDERIERYNQEENPKAKGLLAFLGSIPYGTTDSAREEQITQGMSYFLALRENQQQIQKAIEDLERLNEPRGGRRHKRAVGTDAKSQG
jgi:hypothetical protein